jgi:hypothetical protein
MSSYASFNVALSLCMIMAVIALLVGRSQSFCNDPGFYQFLGENFRFYFACVD